MTYSGRITNNPLFFICYFFPLAFGFFPLCLGKFCSVAITQTYVERASMAKSHRLLVYALMTIRKLSSITPIHIKSVQCPPQSCALINHRASWAHFVCFLRCVNRLIDEITMNCVPFRATNNSRKKKLKKPDDESDILCWMRPSIIVSFIMMTLLYAKVTVERGWPGQFRLNLWHKRVEMMRNRLSSSEHIHLHRKHIGRCIGRLNWDFRSEHE